MWLTLLVAPVISCLCQEPTPVILVPGFAGVGLKVDVNNTTVPACGNGPVVKKDERAWLSFSVWRPPRSHQMCWFNLMRLHYRRSKRRRCRKNEWKCVVGTYETPEHVTVKPYEGLPAVEYLDYIDGYGIPFVRYYHDIAETIRRINATTQSIDLKAFVYDWRFPVWQYDWDGFKKMIEGTGQKAILIAHSMGGIAVNWFLHTKVDQKWKDKHIKALISINGAYGGSMKIARAVLSGYNPAEVELLNHWGLPQILTNKDLRDLARVLGSLWMLTPHERVYDLETPLITVREPDTNQSREFTLRDWMDLAEDADFSAQASRSRKLLADVALRDPGVSWSNFYFTYIY
eukprot:Protomagalhaensia_wolfi_Nauph_80__6273@NODE_95_length_3764_cov_357_568322_g72_i0_p1_GENE_NODE_95_length_3764_cov_357_568322_g72_i0NODE_95_length_3764_cov_357_568322_g72_i0_p1_ORF_typecomplete_len346_score56_64LCAT/PF02450_15/1_3e27PGAP1/PF07819_13/6_2e05Hydrolase_4/PF12146_8/7_2e05DUF915/PF06028_11/2_9e02DUF915/PF06028_11/0_00051Abhydrolase_6/PF12697_7/7_6e05Ser_hydrolase/PF06821_13/0_00054Palm_thioest/PF02089_15/0_0065Lipase_2/PF01674_18/8_5e02Lipase_2/PF01674_18/5_6e03Lipase_2/PF01674_18/0_045